MALTCLGLSLSIGIEASYPSRYSLALSPSPELSAENLIRKGVSSYQQKDYPSAQALFQSALEISEASHIPRLQGLSLIYRGMVFQQTQKWIEAEASIINGLSTLKSVNSVEPRLLALGLNAKASVSLHLGRLEQALTEWEQAEKYYQLSQDSVGELRGEGGISLRP
ncbi:MAG: hypothetical protein HC810_00270 [Acaryochloridaceae cyanobacterium RL_2_7]|nr:hypothetical protein [Acaryochloridaceae cyanobacterium RL_2_7]